MARGFWMSTKNVGGALIQNGFEFCATNNLFSCVLFYFIFFFLIELSFLWMKSHVNSLILLVNFRFEHDSYQTYFSSYFIFHISLLLQRCLIIKWYLSFDNLLKLGWYQWKSGKGDVVEITRSNELIPQKCLFHKFVATDSAKFTLLIFLINNLYNEIFDFIQLQISINYQ